MLLYAFVWCSHRVVPSRCLFVPHCCFVVVVLCAAVYTTEYLVCSKIQNTAYCCLSIWCCFWLFRRGSFAYLIETFPTIAHQMSSHTMHSLRAAEINNPRKLLKCINNTSINWYTHIHSTGTRTVTQWTKRWSSLKLELERPATTHRQTTDTTAAAV